MTEAARQDGGRRLGLLERVMEDAGRDHVVRGAGRVQQDPTSSGCMMNGAPST